MIWLLPCARGMACAAVAAALALAPATASATFAPLGNLSGSSLQSTDPDVAVAGDGDAVATWTRSDTFNDRAQIQMRKAGQAWGSAVYASPVGVDVAQPRIALDANGDATLAWLRDDGSHWVAETRTLSAGGSWSAVQRLSAAGEDASGLRVAVAPDGTATFAWRRAVGPTQRVQSRTRSAGGTLGSTANLSPGASDASEAQVAIGDGGGAVVTWTRLIGARVRVQARRREADGSAGPLLTVSPTGTDAAAPDVAIGPGGNAVVVWRQSGAAGGGWRALLRTVSPAGAVGSLETLSATGRDLRDPHVAVDGAGTAVAAWRRYDGSNWRVQVVGRASDGTLSARYSMSPAGADALDPDVAVAAGGTALVAWRRFTSGHWVFESRERLPDATILGRRAHSDGTQDAFDPRVAMGPDGTAVLLWRPVGGQNGYALRARIRLPDGRYSLVSWLSSTRHSAREARVASNAAGDAVFAWRRLDVTGWRLEARRRAPDGTLGPVVDIGPAALDEAHLRVAIDPAGDALFVWQRFVEHSAYPGVLARAWPAGGGLGPTQTIWSSSRRPEVAMDAAGAATIVSENVTDHGRAIMRTRSPGGTLSSTKVLSSTSEYSSSPRVAVAPDGSAAFAWIAFLGSGDERTRARVRAPDGTFSPIVTVSAAGVAANPAVAIGDDGDALVAWDRQSGSLRQVEGRPLDGSGALGDTVPVSDPGTVAFLPEVAVLPSGAGAFGWVNTSTSSPTRWAQTRALGTDGSLGAIGDVSDPNGFLEGSLDMAATSDGRVVYAWSRYVQPFIKQIESRTRSAAGTLGAVDGLSDPARDAADPHVAASDDTDALAVWTGIDAEGTPRAQGAAGP